MKNQLLRADKVYDTSLITLIITFTVSLTMGLLSLYFGDPRLLILSFYVMLVGIAPIILYMLVVKLRGLF